MPIDPDPKAPIPVKFQPPKLPDAASMAQWAANEYAGPRGLTYWQNPHTVARYYHAMQSAPPDWQSPPWLDREGVNAAYQYMKFRNNNAPWQEWKYLNPNDPAVPFLTNMQTPPQGFDTLYESQVPEPFYMPKTPEQPEQPAISNVGAWENLSPDEQLLVSLFYPGQVGDLPGRPEISRITGALGQGVLAGLGGAAVGGLVGGAVGAGAGAVPGTVAGFLALGGLATANALMMTYTGKSMPVADEILRIFDLAAIGAEIGLGLGSQAKEEGGWENVLANLPEAAKAGELKYETMDTDLVNWYKKAVGLFTGNLEQAAPNQVWQLQKGISDPVALQGGVRGGEALVQARNRMIAGEDPQLVFADYIERFGFTGTFNDFMAQSIVDPLNLAPWMAGKTGQAVGKATGNLRMVEAAKLATGNPLIDVLPFGLQQLVEGGGRTIFQNNPKLAKYFTSSSGILGMKETYKNLIRTGFTPEGQPITAAADLSPYEKVIAGLTDTGAIKELEPGNPKGFMRFMGELSPDAKAHLFQSVMVDNVYNLVELADANPEQMVSLLRQAAGVDPVATGQVGETVMKSPEVATIAVALRDYVKTGIPDEMLTKWTSSAEKRTILLNMARVLGDEPGKFLEALEADPAGTFERIRKAAELTGNKNIIAAMDTGQLTPQGLQDTLGVFMGKDALPWHPDEFAASMMESLNQHTGDFLVQRYGIKPDSWAFRLADTLKSAQSLLLLGFNPAYFVNNAVNNVVTRAAQGVFGQLTPGQIKRWYDRWGYEPTRVGVGIGASESGAKMDTSAIAKAKEVKDLMGQANRAIKGANRSLGIFSRLSSDFESAESRQAYTIGTQNAWNKLWRRGEGFKRMPAALSQMLSDIDPRMTEQIYAAIEAGLNMEEVSKAIYATRFQPQINQVIDAAAAQLFPQNPDIGRQMLKTTGIDAELESKLAQAETPEQVEQAFNEIELELQDYIDQLAGQEMETRAEDVKNRIGAEGVGVIFDLFADIITAELDRWTQHYVETSILANDVASMDRGQANAAYRAWHERSRQEWNRLNGFVLNTYKGIIQALGVDTPETQAFVTGVADAHTVWKNFYHGYDENGTHVDGKNDIMRKFFDKYADRDKYTFEQRQAGWEDALDQVQALFNKAVADEKTNQIKLNELFADMVEGMTGRAEDRDLALGWRRGVMGVRDKMVQSMLAFRDRLRRGKFDDTEKRRMWKEFLEQNYLPAIAEMKNAEMIGAAELAKQQGRPPLTPPVLPEAKATQTGKPGAADAINVEEVNRPIMAGEMPDLDAWLTAQGYNHPTHALNAVNKWLGTKYEKFEDVTLQDLKAGTRKWREEHGLPPELVDIQAHANANSIIDEADTLARQAKVKSEAVMNRRVAREKLQTFEQLTPEQVKGVMFLLDQRAKLWAKRFNRTPDEWWAGIGDFEDGEAGLAQMDRLYQGTRSEPAEIKGEYVDGLRVLDEIPNQTSIEATFDDGEYEILPGIRELPISEFETDKYKLFYGDAQDLRQVEDLAGQIKESGEIAPLIVVLDKNGYYVLEGAHRLAALGELGKNSLPAQIVIDTRNLLFDRFDSPRGAFRLREDGKAIITAFKSAKFDTFVHEIGHLFRRDLGGDDLDAVAQWGGLKDGAEIQALEQQFYSDTISDADRQRYVEAEEQFANGFVRYLAEDNEMIPPKMQSVFQKFAQWLKDIYGAIFKGTPLEVDIQAEVNGIKIKDIFDRLLFEDEMLEVRKNKAEILKTRPKGNETTAFGVDPNQQYRFQYRVVDVDELVMSHTENFGETLEYPKEMQPRDRDRAAYQAQVHKIASELNAEALLMDSKALDTGSPIIGSDMVVESGNGRSMAIREAAYAYPEKYQAYADLLGEHLQDFGLDKKALDGIERPVLVRERIDNVSRMDFAREANRPRGMEMSDIETSAQDAALVSDNMLAQLDIGENETIEGALAAQKNADVIRRFVDALPENERNKFMTDDGRLSQAGLARLRDAMFARVYQGDAGKRLMQRFTESVEPTVQNLKNAMYASLGQMAVAEGLMAKGQRDVDLSIATDLADAVDTYMRVKQAGKMNVKEFVEQPSMTEAPLSDTQKALLLYFYENGRSGKNMRQMIREYANAIADQPDISQMALFDATRPTKTDLLASVTGKVTPDEQGTLFAQPPEENTNALFQSGIPPAPKVGSPEFKAWFKESKVVDENGEPLRVYHGTNADFAEFNSTKRGMFFTAMPDFAGKYALNKGAGANVFPVYLRLENPAIIDRNYIKKIAKEYGFSDVESEVDYFFFSTSPIREDIGQIVRDEGHDGYIIKGDLMPTPDDNKAGGGFVSPVDSYVVFEPTQIKSVFNRGTFDPNNPNILYQRGITPDDLQVRDVTPRRVGPYMITRHVFHNSVLVALMPEKMAAGDEVFKTIGTRDGNARLLGIPEDNPQARVYLSAKGEIKRTDENRPPAGNPQPLGPQPPATVPAPMYSGMHADEVASNHLRPMLAEMRKQYKQQMQMRPLKQGDLPDDAKKQLNAYLNGSVRNDMASTKLAATRYGEAQRDGALLNYGRRYNFDNYLNLIFPYQFWYTRSMVNWAKRMIDKPKWFGMYYRLREAQRRNEDKGIPTRLRGRMRINAPFLPEWMGGSVYIDPNRYLLPYTTFMQPFQQAQMNESKLVQEATGTIRKMAENGIITRQEADLAIQTHTGAAWDRAYTEAQVALRDEVGDPMSLASMIMQPGMYITTPYYALTGQKEKIGTLPMTRMGQGLEATFEGTPIEGLGSAFAAPERAIRRAAGISEFGEWGNYYIDRQLANMAADGEITAQQAKQAMIERQGPNYQAAYTRVKKELALRQPGSLLAEAIKGKGTAAQVSTAILFTLFPSGMLPEGELKLRNLSKVYNKAWDDYKNGDDAALNDFFMEHPEYEARLALYDEPEDRLREFLVNEIWDGYTTLDKANRRLASDQLGEDFQTMFLSPDTRDYTAIDPETLAYWAQALGGVVPMSDETAAIARMPEYMRQQVQLYPPAMTKAINAYTSTKDDLFPMVGIIQNGYYAIPETDKAERRAYLKQFPQLKEYWDWKRQYTDEHPEIVPYLEELKQKASEPEEEAPLDVNTYRQQLFGMMSAEFSPELRYQLIGWVYGDQMIGNGAKYELNKLWERYGKPYGNFEAFLRQMQEMQ